MFQALYILTIAAFLLGQIGRVSLYNGAVNFYLYEVFLTATTLYLVAKSANLFKYIQRHFRKTLIFMGVVLFSFIVTISSFSIYQNVVGALYLFRLYTYITFFFLLSEYLKSNASSRSLISQSLLFSAGFISMASILQILLYPDLRNLFYLGWDEHLNRVFGLFLDTSVAASIYGLLLLFLFFNFLKKGQKGLYLLLALILSVISLFTYSRAFYIAIFVTALYFLIEYSSHLKKFLLFTAFFIVILFFINRSGAEGTNLLRSASVTARAKDYQTGFLLSQRSPIVGVGYNRIEFAKKSEEKNNIPNHAAASFHSSFLIILVSSGFIGLLAFFGLLFDLAKISLNSKYYVVFLSTFSLFDNILLHPFVLFLLFLILSGESVNLSRRSQ